MSLLFLKITAILALVVGVSLPKLLPALMEWTRPALDERIGKIAILSQEQLTPFYQERSTLVVGGTRGVGFGTALAMVRAGAHVTVVGRNEKTGAEALEELQKAAKDSNQQRITFLKGDLGTIKSTMQLVDTLSNNSNSNDSTKIEKYDYLVVSAAVYPDWNTPLRNEDSLDKSLAVSVVGRFLIYRHMHRFIKPQGGRVLNVLAAGAHVPLPFDRELVEGRRTVRYLFEAMHHFSVGNELMLIGMEEFDTTAKQFTRVSTHPGIVHTDLNRNQGLWFDVLKTIGVAAMGISVEQSGLQQASILCSDRLPTSSLVYVDEFAKGRKRSTILQSQVDKHLDWFWSFLTNLEPAQTSETENS